MLIEVIFVQPVYRMRKEGNAQPSPADQHVRVMLLVLRDFRNLVGKRHGLAEVLECKLPLEVMTVHRPPALVELP